MGRSRDAVGHRELSSAGGQRPMCGWAGVLVRVGRGNNAQKSIFWTILRRPNWPIDSDTDGQNDSTSS